MSLVLALAQIFFCITLLVVQFLAAPLKPPAVNARCLTFQRLSDHTNLQWCSIQKYTFTMDETDWDLILANIMKSMQA